MKNLVKYIAGQFSKPKGIGGKLSTFVMNNMNRKQYKSIIENIDNNKSYKILDIGFGNGFLLKKISKKSISEFWGIEISEDMIKVAEKRNRKLINEGLISLIYGDVMNLPFEDNFFDIVYTVNTIYFWENLESGLLEIKRVLKQSGVFINAFYSKEWLDSLTYTQFGFKKYDIEELEEIIITNGFKINKIEELKPGISYCIIIIKV